MKKNEKLEVIKIFENPEVVKSDERIAAEWRKNFKKIFEIITKDKKYNLSLSQFKPCYEELMTGIINDFLSLDEKIYYLKQLYNSHSYLEDENLPQERTSEKEQYNTYKEIIYEKIQELETNQIKKISRDQIIKTYMKINGYYNETIDALNKRGKISIEDFEKIYNHFTWAFENDNKIKNIRPEARPDFRIDYIEWAEKILAISETHVIIYTIKDLAVYKEKLNEFIENNKEKQRH